MRTSQTMYHGTDATITGIDREMCLTDDRDAAQAYGPTVYLIEVTGADLADEDTIREAAEAVYGADDSWLASKPWTFELLDDTRVQAKLTEWGYSGAEFADATEDNAIEHDTIRVWDTSTLTLMGVAA